MNWEIAFKITPESIERFAEFTGDRNPQHLDEQFARRFRYRERVAHGMLAFSYLVFLQELFPRISFSTLAAQFRRPVYIGDELICAVDYHETEAGRFEFSATWKNKASDEEVITSTGAFHRNEPDGEPPSPTTPASSFLPKQLTESCYLINDLEGRREAFLFLPVREAAQSFTQMLAHVVLSGKQTICPPAADANFYSTLLLSTLVGMKLPGRFATFLSFEINFDTAIAWNKEHTINGAATKVSVASSRLSVGVEFANAKGICAQGKCSVIVSSAPKPMLTFDQIANEHSELGLRGKVVLITGASRGIGEVTAKLFAALGAKVAINYYKGKQDAERIACEITQSGGEAICVQCDVRNETEVNTMVSTVIGRFGTIDVLVNNAVKDANPKNLVELEWSDFLGEMEVSVKGLHNCCRAVVPIFQKMRRGKIVNLSTIFTDSPVSGQAKYITAKNAVVGYTRSLARELARDNIQANVVAPNMVETDLVATISASFREKLAEERDYGRHLRPIEVAQCIAFLSSPWSDAMTGQRIVLNLGEAPFL